MLNVRRHSLKKLTVDRYRNRWEKINSVFNIWRWALRVGASNNDSILWGLESFL
jgi:hypothetical protein